MMSDTQGGREFHVDKKLQQSREFSDMKQRYIIDSAVDIRYGKCTLCGEQHSHLQTFPP